MNKLLIIHAKLCFLRLSSDEKIRFVLFSGCAQPVIFLSFFFFLSNGIWLQKLSATTYSNSERSEQLLVTECFLTYSRRFLRSNKFEQLEFKLEKNIGI